VDGDAIPYRTAPGVKDPKGSWFARGTGHTPAATYSEDPDNYRENMDRLVRKFETARSKMPPPVIHRVDGAKIGFVYYGTSEGAVEEAIDRTKDQGVKISTMRVRALPFGVDTLRAFVEAHDKVYVIEQNRDKQMLEILASWTPDLATRYHAVSTYDGLPLSADLIIRNVDELKGQEV